MFEEDPALPGEAMQEPAVSENDRLMEQIAEQRAKSLNLAAPVQESVEEPAQRRVIEHGLDEVYVKVKVDGEEREVPVAEVVKHYQLDDAAERRFQQAKAEREEWARKNAELDQIQLEMQRQAEKPAQQPASGHDTKDDPVKQRKAALKSILDAWSLGDEELPEEEVKLLFGNAETKQEAVNPNAIAAQVRWEMDFEAANGRYQADYPELAQDPYLNQITQQRVGEYLQHGYYIKDAILNGAKDVKEWLSNKSGRAQGDGKPADSEQPGEGQAQREQARANLTGSSTANARIPVSQPSPKTLEQARRETIEEMKAGIFPT